MEVGPSGLLQVFLRHRAALGPNQPGNAYHQLWIVFLMPRGRVTRVILTQKLQKLAHIIRLQAC